MKVLYITNCPAPYRVSFFNELTRYCEVTVAFEMGKAKNREEKWKSGEEYKFNAIFLKSWFCRQESAFCPEIIKYIKLFQNDIIVVGGYSTPTGMWGISYMKAHGIPYILNCDGGMIKNDSRMKYNIKKFFISKASAWLSTGKSCDQYLVNYGADKEYIYRYPFSSIKQKDIGRKNLQERLTIRRNLEIKENKVILFVGSFIYRKGIDILLEACADMEDVALVLIGGNNISDLWSGEIDNLKCRVYIEGFKSETEVKKYYQAADIFVLPTREDIWGLVINESMAAGLPVITTDKCGAGLELIKNGVNGYIIQSEDSFSLKEKIETLLADDSLVRDMRSQNINLMRFYNIEQMAKNHYEIFQNIENEDGIHKSGIGK